MVDVNRDLMFPTPLTIFKCGFKDLGKFDRMNMISYIQQNANKNKAPHQTIDDLYKLSTFRKLYDIIMEQCHIHIQGLEYEYDKLDMTSMWGNYLASGEYHPPHTHSNSFISGVFYLLSPDGSDGKPAGANIEFIDPRMQSGILVPRRKETNQLNSNMLAYPCIEGWGYIFPSWLQHTVKTTLVDRMSISWNILPRGDYGEPNTLQNAHI